VSERHEFFQLMRQATDTMAAEYGRIRARTLQDPGTAAVRILHAIEDEEWMPCLLYWRSHDDPGTGEAQTHSSSTRAGSRSRS
jgi:hypothetical protein